MIYTTPDVRFARLPDWPWAPRLTVVHAGPPGPLRMAHHEAGPEDGSTVVLLHGDCAWSFGFRHVIPRLAAAGLRVLAVDLPGFGRSDKPLDPSAYSYAQMLAWLAEWFDRQGLVHTTLVAQGWGGILGLRLVATWPERFARVVVVNAFLPHRRQRLSDGLQRWRAFLQQARTFDVAAAVNQLTSRGIGGAAAEAYKAPFPLERHKVGPRRLPFLLPERADDPEFDLLDAAWQRLERFDRPLLVLNGDADPLMLPYAGELKARIRGAAGQPHAILARAGHMVQEDAPDELAAHLLAFMGLLDTCPAGP